ncbi:discoidin domain-containing protein [Amycolatopsis azurea]|uniref:Chitinase n=1 Tax=Amycolatopsis azurea DSM 43854 TaxID=1238180 RepID=M2Q8W3_9PSEU|nr:Chitinase [Amycolatopsis azurea DSM 43854]
MKARTRLLPLGAAAILLPTLLSGNAQAADVLLSQGKPVIVSSVESSSYAGALAVDGKTTTRWASAEGADPQFIRVDLGGPSAVNRVKLSWEAAYATAYRLEVSNDGSAWTSIKSVTNGNGGTDDLTGLSGKGRYLRLVGTKRATSYGYSLWEIQVYGTSDSTGDTQAPTAPTNLKAGTITSSTVDLTWTASTDNVGVTGYEVLRNGQVVGTTESASFSDSGLTAATAYTYSVRAKDAAGNTSAASGAIQATTQAGGGSSFVLAASGDIAEQCTASSSSCIHPKTANLVGQMNPAAVITMGDNQYDDAHIEDFTKYFDKTWGKYKNIMHPIPGNHETYDDTPLGAYKKYFGKIATPNGKTYYSWEMGNWHFVAIDSTEFSPGLAANAVSDEQLNWIKQDLKNNTKPCVAAYYHHPRYTSGDHGDNDKMATLWETMVQNKVDLVLNGHDHHYERFYPQNADGDKDPAGPVQIIGGGGGATLYPVKTEHPATAKAISTYGVLKLNMSDNAFSTQLIGLDGKTIDSSPTYTCH